MYDIPFPEIALPTVELVDLDDIKPYWRNPRKIPEEAVEAVRQSIQRFGYQTPIVVDLDHVIITGHTRYSVLRQLGVTRVPVIVSDLPPDLAKEYRVIDNRTQEFTSWDDNLLYMELKEWETDLLARFFPEVTLDGETSKGITVVTAKDVERAHERVMTSGADLPEKRRLVDIVCPNCFKPFTIEPPEV